MRSDRTILLKRELLNQERERVISKLTRLHNTLQSKIDPDSDDGASDLEEHENAMALIPGLNGRLEAIDQALQRVERGTYGFCEHCGEPIDPARLEAVPEAAFCVRCKTVVERQTRLRTTARSREIF
jgi:DnaK suppressor protein